MLFCCSRFEYQQPFFAYLRLRLTDLLGGSYFSNYLCIFVFYIKRIAKIRNGILPGGSSRWPPVSRGECRQAERARSANNKDKVGSMKTTHAVTQRSGHSSFTRSVGIFGRQSPDSANTIGVIKQLSCKSIQISSAHRSNLTQKRCVHDMILRSKSKREPVQRGEKSGSEICILHILGVFLLLGPIQWHADSYFFKRS